MFEPLQPMVNADVLQGADALCDRFRHAGPFRHVVIDDFFTTDFADRLLAEFPAFDQGNFIGDDGRPGGKSTLARIRALGPGYEALDDALKSAPMLGLVGRLTGIDGLLYDPFYLGGGTHENRDGQSLQTHIDFNFHPSERWHRRLNLIVYLNREWDEAWGGNLDLYRDPYEDARPAARIVPRFNRCVIFETSEHSWHGFERIVLPADRRDLSRKSIAVYFYTTHRPAGEIAGKHSTHYVDAQLPERFVEGHVLSAVDVAALHELIAHRDGQLRRLYAENAGLLQAQERGFGGQILYLLKRLYVRYRR